MIQKDQRDTMEPQEIYVKKIIDLVDNYFINLCLQFQVPLRFNRSLG
jgi:hypothetical protein